MRTAKSRSSASQRFQPQLETLEDRWVPATIVPKLTAPRDAAPVAILVGMLRPTSPTLVGPQTEAPTKTPLTGILVGMLKPNQIDPQPAPPRATPVLTSAVSAYFSQLALASNK